MVPHREGELAFTFPSTALSVVKFDDPVTHGASGMKAVDFIVEFADFDLYIEVKDADNSATDQPSRAAFLEKLKSGRLENDLTYKYRDTRTYRWCAGKASKPARYVVVLELRTLLPRDFQLWTDNLKRRLPLDGPASWSRPLVDQVFVMNAATWNKLGLYGAIVRESR